MGVSLHDQQLQVDSCGPQVKFAGFSVTTYVPSRYTPLGNCSLSFKSLCATASCSNGTNKSDFSVQVWL